jgi:hypothetical protein
LFAPHPDAVSQPLFDRTEIGVIRFTTRIARQCSPRALRVPDWVVCDTIANGARTRASGRGTRGGVLVRFEKTFPGAAGGDPVNVRLLGELTRSGCFALHLFSPGRVRRKMWDNSGFFIRTCSK